MNHDNQLNGHAIDHIVMISTCITWSANGLVLPMNLTYLTLSNFEKIKGNKSNQHVYPISEMYCAHTLNQNNICTQKC